MLSKTSPRAVFGGQIHRHPTAERVTDEDDVALPDVRSGGEPAARGGHRSERRLRSVSPHFDRTRDNRKPEPRRSSDLGRVRERTADRPRCRRFRGCTEPPRAVGRPPRTSRATGSHRPIQTRRPRCRAGAPGHSRDKPVVGTRTHLQWVFRSRARCNWWRSKTPARRRWREEWLGPCRPRALRQRVSLVLRSAVW